MLKLPGGETKGEDLDSANEPLTKTPHPAPIVQPAKMPWLARQRKRALITKHRIKHWFGQPGLSLRLLYVAAWLYLVLSSVAKAGWTRETIGAAITVVVVWARRAWAHSRPKMIQFLQFGYEQRKLLLYRLVQGLRPGRTYTLNEVRTFREDALRLVVLYARHYRGDHSEKRIYANVLVEDGDDMVVLTRDKDHRTGTPRYPKRLLIAATALHTGEPQLVGDLYVEYPETAPGKKYNSILAIPIFLDQRAVGVVSIDSTARYDFHAATDDLVSGLMPYVSLLAWTLERTYVSHELAKELPPVGLPPEPPGA